MIIKDDIKFCNAWMLLADSVLSSKLLTNHNRLLDQWKISRIKIFDNKKERIKSAPEIYVMVKLFSD